MTNVKHFVGIDVSKHCFDAAIVINLSQKQFTHQRFACTPEGFKDFHTFLKVHCGNKQQETLICMEYTGIYNWPITESLNDTSYILCLEMAMQIKYSLGVQRGKNDELDAKRIAEYAYVQREKLRQWQPSGKTIEKLQHLSAARERLLKTIQLLEVPVKEIAQAGNKEMADLLTRINKKTVVELEKALVEADKKLQETLKQDETVWALYERITSVIGIGKTIGLYLLIYTKGFTILANKKKLGSYAGVVPFEHSSGKSVRKKSQTSKMSNATLRCKLAQGAKSAMQWDPQLKAYAERKMGEGKSYGWCVNAVSNKLLARVVACVNNQKDYVKREAA